MAAGLIAAIVSGIAPELPVAVVAAGPMVIHADPFHTFNCPLIVSYHCSPGTGVVVKLLAYVIVAMVFHTALAVPFVVAVFMLRYFVVVFHHNCPGKGAVGCDPLAKFSINFTMF